MQLQTLGVAHPALQRAAVPFTPFPACNAAVKDFLGLDSIRLDNRGQMCAGATEENPLQAGNPDSCDGDSGGPLLAQGSGGEVRMFVIILLFCTMNMISTK